MEIILAFVVWFTKPENFWEQWLFVQVNITKRAGIKLAKASF